MANFIDTNEVVSDLGASITSVLKQHGIDPVGVQVKVFDDQIRILVKLEGDEE